MGELWSGFLGAIIGAVIGGTGTFLTVRWQTKKLLSDERERARESREEERRDWLQRRQEQALTNLLAVLSVLQGSVPQLYALPATRHPMLHANPDDRAKAEYAHETLLHGLRVDLPLVLNSDLRARYQSLVRLVEELARLGLGETTEERERWRGDVIRYISYVRHAMKNLLHGDGLPRHADPPVLTRQDQALWTAPETDPEDTYFPDQAK